jgi:hypothetical protein
MMMNRATTLAEGRVLVMLDRLYREQPVAFAAFVQWCEEPGHTSSVTLHFREGKFQFCERNQTAR